MKVSTDILEDQRTILYLMTRHRYSYATSRSSTEIDYQSRLLVFFRLAPFRASGHWAERMLCNHGTAKWCPGLWPGPQQQPLGNLCFADDDRELKSSFELEMKAVPHEH